MEPDRPLSGKRLALLLLLPFGIAMQAIAGRVSLLPDTYAVTLFPVISRALGTLTGWIPFSVAEILAVVATVAVLVVAMRALLRLVRRRRRIRNVLLHGAVNALILAGLAYGGGLLLWGLNYHRTDFAERAGWDTRAATPEELRALAEFLVARTNAARREVREDGAGVMRLSRTRRQAFGRVYLGFHAARRAYPIGDGYVGRAKGFRLLSTPLSYLGIGGIFVMFTGEPTVNTKPPDAELLSAACHEVAHQLGHAPEDEASFVGYLACTRHPDADFRYSGYLRASGHAMRALFRAEPDAFHELAARYDDGVLRDRAAIAAFWRAYESRTTEIAYRANDLYLKSQGQTAGVSSYGRMVDLLVAERRVHPAGIDLPQIGGRPHETP